MFQTLLQRWNNVSAWLVVYCKPLNFHYLSSSILQDLYKEMSFKILEDSVSVKIFQELERSISAYLSFKIESHNPTPMCWQQWFIFHSTHTQNNRSKFIKLPIGVFVFEMYISLRVILWFSKIHQVYWTVRSNSSLKRLSYLSVTVLSI